MRVIDNVPALIQVLQRKERTGWVARKVRQPETVWQHTEMMVHLMEPLAKKHLGAEHVEHCKALATWHDMPEGIMPDITPHCGVTGDQKRELELLIIDHIGNMPFYGAFGKACLLEYDAQETKAAQFVEMVDKYQMAKEALEIERTNRCDYSLQAFWDYVYKKLAGGSLIEEFYALQCKRPDAAFDKPEIKLEPLPAGSFETIKRDVLRKIGRSVDCC